MSSASRWLVLSRQHIRQFQRLLGQRLLWSRLFTQRGIHGATLWKPVRKSLVQPPFTRSYYQTSYARWKPSKPGLSYYSTQFRKPQGVPRNLFTNWNMGSSGMSGGRMYSTAYTKFTHEAVNNMNVSLRCFFQTMNDLVGIDPVTGKTADQATATAAFSHMHSCNRCNGKSLMRNKEIMQMIQMHKEQVAEEAAGCVVEFELPTLQTNEIPNLGSTSIETEYVMHIWNETITQYIKSLQQIQNDINSVIATYGSLPIRVTAHHVRIHFPTLTVKEVEQLVTDINVTNGIVYKEEPLPEEPTNNNGMTSRLSTVSLSEISSFSPILSDGSSEQYVMI